MSLNTGGGGGGGSLDSDLLPSGIGKGACSGSIRERIMVRPKNTSQGVYCHE